MIRVLPVLKIPSRQDPASLLCMHVSVLESVIVIVVQAIEPCCLICDRTKYTISKLSALEKENVVFRIKTKKNLNSMT
jgi:hypothetical protein